ncbi:endo-1,3(4)-beta-glucanase [Planoprotostelium fungivorum]|uniref:Endo-1,3(4)-beta-glucanase n=1 Tax=Planoprotostelium fungivorum TaxID=1890364 RepID=A0A2P6N3S0_9EUKA|nr:endo-1,3(4)-beta-glucanase [Planoprotostelium fungivorum]
MSKLFVALLALLCVSAVAGKYQLSFDFGKQNFFDNWNFFTGNDPTNGHVKFVSQSEAKSAGLISTSGSNIYMGVDHTNNATDGRRAVRLQSKQAWSRALFVLVLPHMPGAACGVWPAFWSNGPGTWPYGGEIDVLEGVNKLGTNQYTLHTGPNCQMPASRNMTGKWVQSNNCDNTMTASGGGGAGCAVGDQDGTFGSAFNKRGGGAIAYDIRDSGIRAWTFTKDTLPSDIRSDSIDTAQWPQPNAYFPFGSSCSADHFGAQTLIFDITFCGDWAGSNWVYNTQAACPGSCKDFVSYNPKAFSNTYWTIESLKVYQGN